MCATVCTLKSPPLVQVKQCLFHPTHKADCWASIDDESNSVVHTPCSRVISSVAAHPMPSASSSSVPKYQILFQELFLPWNSSHATFQLVVYIMHLYQCRLFYMINNLIRNSHGALGLLHVQICQPRLVELVLYIHAFLN